MLESLLVPIVARLDDAIVARPVNERIHPGIGADGRITDRLANLESVVADGRIKNAEASDKSIGNDFWDHLNLA